MNCISHTQRWCIRQSANRSRRGSQQGFGYARGIPQPLSTWVRNTSINSCPCSVFLGLKAQADEQTSVALRINLRTAAASGSLTQNSRCRPNRDTRSAVFLKEASAVTRDPRKALPERAQVWDAPPRRLLLRSDGVRLQLRHGARSELPRPQKLPAPVRTCECAGRGSKPSSRGAS